MKNCTEWPTFRKWSSYLFFARTWIFPDKLTSVFDAFASISEEFDRQLIDAEAGAAGKTEDTNYLFEYLSLQDKFKQFLANGSVRISKERRSRRRIRGIDPPWFVIDQHWFWAVVSFKRTKNMKNWFFGRGGGSESKFAQSSRLAIIRRICVLRSNLNFAFVCTVGENQLEPECGLWSPLYDWLRRQQSFTMIWWFLDDCEIIILYYQLICSLLSLAADCSSFPLAATKTIDCAR